MASVIYLDTHAVVWLYLGQPEWFPGAAQAAINENDLLISPMVLVELQSLFEIKRVAEPARTVLEALGQELGLRVCDLPFGRVAHCALDQEWTRDPFDRLIVSHAILREAPLVTKDLEIRANYPRTLWDASYSFQEKEFP